MKSYEKLNESYELQKQIFETARNKRILNRQKQIDQINQKINSLEDLRSKLISENQTEREFESFDSFRLQAEKQKQQSILQTTKA